MCDHWAWPVDALKSFLSSRGIKTSLYKKETLVKLTDLAVELNLPRVLEKDDDHEESLAKRFKVESNGDAQSLIDIRSISVWSEDLKNLPNIESADVFVYLLEHCQWTHARLKNYRKDDGYMLYQDKHISAVATSNDDNKYRYIKGKCTPQTSQNSEPYDAWIVIEDDGCLKTAGCTCVAGDDGSCKHVVALAFSLVCFLDRHKDRNTQVSTDITCTWDVPRKCSYPSQIEYLDTRVTNREFDIIEPNALNYQPLQLQNHQAIEAGFVSLCRTAAPNCLMLQMLGNSENDVTETVPSIEKVVSEYKQKFPSYATFPNSIDHFNTFLQVKMPSKFLEAVKRIPQGSEEWKCQRMGRITASNFGELYKSKHLSRESSVVQKVLGKNKFMGNAHTKYGNINEPVARNLYIEKMKENGHNCITVEEVGLCIDNVYLFLGASPDGLVECKCCGYGLLEIKCLSSKRDCSLNEICNSSNHKNLAWEEDDSFHLKEFSNWYYQVQGQMGVLKRKWCDFVVYTNKGIAIERILFNGNIWDKLTSKFKNIYMENIFSQI